MKNKREKSIALCFLAAELCLGIWIIGNCFAVGRMVAAAGQVQTVSEGDAGAGAAGEETSQEDVEAAWQAASETDGNQGETKLPGTAGTVSGNGTENAAGTVSGNGTEGTGGAAMEAFSQTVSGGDAARQEDEDDEYANLAIANVDHYVNVRNAPSTDGEIVGKLYDGSVAQILAPAGENNEWFQVISGSVEGYVKAEFFIYGDAAAAVVDDYVLRYVTVQADRLNVRREPDMEAAKIGYISRGENISLLEDCGEWLKVQYTEQSVGYVSAEYVVVTETFIYAKSIEEEQAELAAQRALAERAREMEEAARQEAAAAAEQNGGTGQNNAAGQESAAQTGQDGGVPAGTDTALGGQPADGAPEAGTDTAGAGESGAELTGQVYTDNEELRAAIVEYALQYLGNVYVHGGKSLDSGTDCSGFTCFIYADFGYSISRTPSGQFSSAGRSIDYSEIQPGDIICYTSNGGRSCTHVGLYIGDGQIIHAANSRKGVIISDADYSTIMGVKNVID